MAEQHRATSDEWACVNEYKSEISFSCLLELLHRIEALEATQHAHVDLSHLSDAEREKILKQIANPSRFEVLEVAQPVKHDHNEAVTTIPINCRALCIELLDKYDLEWRARERLKEVLAQPNYPEKPNSSLERRVSEHIKAQSVLTAALVKRLEVLEGVPLDGAVPAKVPGGLPALAEKVKALEDTVNATTQPSHPAEIPDSSLMVRLAVVIENGIACDRDPERIARDVIRAEAAWLRKHKQFGAAVWSQRLKEGRAMTDTTRELIQRMATELDLYRQLVLDDCTSTHRFADEARALLAQPEPEGPTDEELNRLMHDFILGGESVEDFSFDYRAFARAVLACWGPAL
jgi:hypothetical protein